MKLATVVVMSPYVMGVWTSPSWLTPRPYSTQVVGVILHAAGRGSGVWVRERVGGFGSGSGSGVWVGERVGRVGLGQGRVGGSGRGLSESRGFCTISKIP